ncbi:MAG: DUF3769 domain-containing protein, partial [Cyanobacteria bacterium P01_D01_bin.73]
MTYPAPPPELPPQTTPVPQVVVQTPPSAAARPEPAAPAPLRQVIEQLPPATAADLGQPVGVVSIRSVREVAGDRTSPAADADSPSPSLPPLSNPVTTPESSIGRVTQESQLEPRSNSRDNSAVAERSNRSSASSVAAPSTSLSANGRANRRSPLATEITENASVPNSRKVREVAQNPAQNSAQSTPLRNTPAQNTPAQDINQRSPFEPEPLNPIDEPITPALPPATRTPGTKANEESSGIDTAPTGTEPTPNPNVQRLDLPTDLAGAVEVTADQQEYDEVRNVVIAIGNAVVRFQGAVISGDRIQINLNNRIALAEGEVAFKRGQQLLRGERLEYNLVQGDGILLNGYGEINRTTLGPDLASGEAVVGPYNPALDRPLSDRITGSDPLTNVRQTGQFAIEAGTGNVGIVDPPPGQTGEIQNFRFEADRIEFEPNGWIAENARLTNDPFSPPELELRTPRLRFQRLSPLRDELVAEKGRWVIDDSFSFPLIPSRTVFDRRELPPEPFRIRYDEEERGGVFIERTFTVLRTPRWRFDVTPQFHVQRAFFDGDSGFFSPDAWGGKARLVGNITPKLSVLGIARFSSFDLDEFDDRFRGSLRANQIIDTPWGPHTLSAEYS